MNKQFTNIKSKIMKQMKTIFNKKVFFLFFLLGAVMSVEAQTNSSITETFCQGNGVRRYAVDTPGGTPGSTYAWSITGVSAPTPIPDANPLITNAITINWGNLSGNFVVHVVETTTSTGCIASEVTLNVIINALPTATISYASPYCAIGLGTVTQTGQTGGNYTSTAGLVIDALTGEINLATSTAGTYTVTYNFTNGTCSNSATTTVIINALPTATISYASPYCATGLGAVTQTGQTGGTYSSTAGLIIGASSGEINLVTSIAGTYTVTYNFTNGTCSNSTTASVVINALPTATISYASPFCATGLGAVTQTGQAGGTYSSTAGLIINASTGEINLATSVSGTYAITYTFSNGTCSNTTTTSVIINVLPTATISYASPFCAIGFGAVTQTGQTGGTYSSTSGLVINASTGEINLATSTAGTYLVTYTFSNGTCSNTTTASVIINALPIATISYASPFCATGFGTVTQTGQAGGNYSSTAGLIINAISGEINLTTSTAGTYIVTYSFTNGTCSNTTTTSVTINALPTATISYTSPYCGTGLGAVTQTGQTGGNYSSTAGLVIDSLTGVINLSTSVAGTYTVTYTFSNGICSNTTIAIVTVNALPTTSAIFHD